MKRYILFILFLFFLSTNLTGQELLTVAEKSNFTETSRYKDVIGFLSTLQALSQNIKITCIATTAEGRDIPMAILGNPPLVNPITAKESGKPVVLLMANIHAGEVEGKEASLMLMREILTGSLGYVLDSINLLVIPLFNADGNEKISPRNRRSQNGPSGGVGIRYNGQNLDLNRDYIKLESYEVKGLVNVFNEWDPAIFVDQHTTDGSYHQEPVTYSGPLNPVGNKDIFNYVWKNLLPEITKNMKEKDNVMSIPYGNYMDYRNVEKGWSTFSHLPRFGTNYYGLRNRMSILVENYAYADFKTRVYGCYSLLKNLVIFASSHSDEILLLIKKVDYETIKKGMNPTNNYVFGKSFDLGTFEKPVTINGYEFEVIKTERGYPRLKRKNVKKVYTLPYYAKYSIKESIPMPFGYIIPEYCKEIIPKLKQHGVIVQKLVKPVNLEVQAFKIKSIESSKNIYQGHHLNTLKGEYEILNRNFPAGTFFVGIDQPIAPLVAYLLEPESDDGLCVWNYFDKYIVGQWRRVPGYYPVFRLLKPVKLNSMIVK
ncbi:hypothetical protein DRQ09_02390 [candidate division KSB1 bacterium]|nr:MAG: hypothetical protein DRQ09_02390 [candidate division KSB1 bacterium]